MIRLLVHIEILVIGLVTLNDITIHLVAISRLMASNCRLISQARRRAFIVYLLTSTIVIK